MITNEDYIQKYYFGMGKATNYVEAFQDVLLLTVNNNYAI